MAKKKELTPAEKEQKRQLKNLKERLRYYEHKGYDISDFNIPSLASEMYELRGERLVSELTANEMSSEKPELYEETSEADSYTDESTDYYNDYSDEYFEDEATDYYNDYSDEYFEDEESEELTPESYDDFVDGREYTPDLDSDGSFEPPVFDIFSFLEEKILDIPDYKEYRTRYQRRKGKSGQVIPLSGYKNGLLSTLRYRIDRATENGELPALANYFMENYEALQAAFESIQNPSDSEPETTSAYAKAMEILKGGTLNDEEREEIEDYTSEFEHEDFF